LINNTVEAKELVERPILNVETVAILTMRVASGGALSMSDISFNFVALDEF
jgi:hypothetical protein